MEWYKLNDLLEEMVLEERRFFSPLFICERLNTIDLKEVTTLMLSEHYKDVITLNFEVQCPEGDTDFIVSNLKFINREDIRICHHCGTEYIPDPKNIWISFNFTDKYINHVKKKKKCITNHPLKRKKTKLLMNV